MILQHCTVLLVYRQAAFVVGGIRFSAAGIVQSVLRPGDMGRKQQVLVSTQCSALNCTALHCTTGQSLQ